MEKFEISFEIVVDLPLEEALSNLQTHTRESLTLKDEIFGYREAYIGILKGNHFTLDFPDNRAYYFITGTLRQNGHGTLVSGYFKLTAAGVLTILVSYLFVATFAFMGLYLAVSNKRISLFEVLLPAVGLIIYLGLPYYVKSEFTSLEEGLLARLEQPLKVKRQCGKK